jgi:hypothetical protein
MSRLIVKYERFFKLFGSNTGKTVVPTLDVDLAWHTHQLSPSSYYEYSMKMTSSKVFVNHDDKIEESKLSAAFEWTSKTYQKEYGLPYSECECWYCNAVREAHDSSASSKLFGTGRKKSGGGPLGPSDPHKAPHISAHNAVRLEQFAAQRGAYDARLNRAYEQACKKATKAGKPVPTRDAFMYSAFGTALAVTVFGAALYAPYMADAFISPGYYVCNPGCMALGAGDWGNCAAGTCGGTVAAGGCGAGGNCGAGGEGGCGSAGGDSGGCGGGCGGRFIHYPSFPWFDSLIQETDWHLCRWMWWWWLRKLEVSSLGFAALRYP